MFSSTKKRILSIVLIIAMILSNAGMTTFAASINRVAKTAAEVETNQKKELTYKYYEQYKYESKTVLLNDDSSKPKVKTFFENIFGSAPEDNSADGATEKNEVLTVKEGEAGTGAENSSANENEEGSDTESISDENKNDENIDNIKNSDDENEKESKDDDSEKESEKDTSVSEEPEQATSNTEGSEEKETTTTAITEEEQTTSIIANENNDVDGDKEVVASEENLVVDEDTTEASSSEIDDDNENDDNKNDENIEAASTSDVDEVAEVTASEINDDTKLVESDVASESDIESDIASDSDIASESDLDIKIETIATNSDVKLASESEFRGGKWSGTLPIYYQYYDESNLNEPVASVKVNSGFNCSDCDNIHVRLNGKISIVKNNMPDGYELSNGSRAKIGWGLIAPDRHGELSKENSGGIIRIKDIYKSVGYNEGMDLNEYDISAGDKDRWSNGMATDWHGWRYAIGRCYPIVGQNPDGSFNWDGAEIEWIGFNGSDLQGCCVSWSYGNNHARYDTDGNRVYLSGTIPYYGSKLNKMTKAGPWHIFYTRNMAIEDLYFTVKVKVKKKAYTVRYVDVDTNFNYIQSSGGLIMPENTKIHYFGDKFNSINDMGFEWRHILDIPGKTCDRWSGTYDSTYRELLGVYDVNKNKLSFPITYAGTTCYYFVWDWKSYEIKYDYNGGTLSSGSAKKSRKFNQAINQSDLPSASQMKRVGYTLDYWEYNGKKIENLAGNTDTVITAKAVWKKNKVTMKAKWADKVYKATVKTIKFAKNQVVDANKEIAFGNDDSMSLYQDGNTITIYADSTNKIYSAESLESVFSGFENLETIDFGGIFDTSNVKSIKNLFNGNKKLKSVNFGSNDLQSVTDATGLFNACEALTSVSFGSKGLSELTNATNMFNGCKAIKSISFGKDDLNKVTNAEGIFSGCKALTSVTFGANSLKSITSAKNMFKDCEAIKSIDFLNADLSKVTNANGMFSGCKELTTIKTNSTNFGTLTDKADTFKDCTKLVGGAGYKYNENNISGDFARIDLGGLKPGYFTLPDSAYMNQKLEINNFNIADADKTGITDIAFENTAFVADYDSEIALGNGGFGQKKGKTLHINFSSKLADKKVFAKGSFKDAFAGFDSLENITGLDKLDTADVTSMENMFKGNIKLTAIDITKLNTKNVTNMASMFASCSSITTLDLTNTNFDKVTNIDSMFEDAGNLTTITVSKNNIDIKGAKASKDVFKGCISLTGNGAYGYDPAMVDGVYARAGYGYIAPGYFTCTDTSYMNGVKIYVANDWYKSTSTVKSAISKVEIKVDEPLALTSEHFLMDAEQGTWGYVVGGEFTTSFAHELGKLYVKDDMSSMFAGFTGATEINGLNNIDTSEVTNMSNLFAGDSTLTSIDAFYLDTAKVTNMSHIFEGCDSLTNINLKGTVGTNEKTFDTSLVTNMSYAFASCSSVVNLSLDDWNFERVLDASHMFENANSLTTIKVTGNVRAFGSTVVNAHSNPGSTTNVDTTDMFLGCTSLVGGTGYVYTDLHTDGEFARVDYGGIMPGYFTVDDYTKVPKIYLDKDWANTLTKSGVQNIEFVRGSIGGVVGVDVTEIELYDDTTHGGKILAYKDGSIIRIAFGDTAGNTIDRIYTSKDFSAAFADFTNLQYINGLNYLDTSETTNMQSLFKNDEALLELDLSGFTLSQVENASSFFENCKQLTEATITYNVTDASHLFGPALKDASKMFKGCEKIVNLDISRFRIINVDNISSMFEGMAGIKTFRFPSSFGNKTKNMSSLFKDCTSIINIDLSSLVTNQATDMTSMFEGCISLVNLNLVGFSTARVEKMEGMFRGCVRLNVISSDDFDTTCLTDNGTEMFYQCYMLDGGAGTTYAAQGLAVVTDVRYAVIDGSIDSSTLATRPGYFRAPNMYKLIPGFAAGHADIASISKISFVEGVANEPTWTTQWLLPNSFGLIGYLNDAGDEIIIYAASESSVKPIYAAADSSYLFGGLDDTTGVWKNLTEIANLNVLDTSKVIVMEGMFKNSAKLTSIDLSNFDTANVSDMTSMFENVQEVTTLDLSSFNTDIVTEMGSMFRGAENLTDITLSNDFGSAAINMSYMFAGDKKLATTEGSSVFNISKLSTAYAENLSYMFYECESIVDVVLPTRNVGISANNLSHMFDGAKSITSLDLTRFNVANATNMSYMFASMSELTVAEINNWNTSNVIDMSYMFAGDSKLTTLRLPSATNLTNVLDISYMLSDLTSLTTLDLVKFENATNMEGLLKNDVALSNLTMPDNFVGNSTTLKSIFENCASLTELDLQTWNTSNVLDMSYMFASCSELVTIKASALFEVAQVTDSTDMFLNLIKIIGHEGTTYSAANVTSTYAIIDNASAGHPGYFTGAAYTFGPGWNYVAGRSKSEITTIEFKVANGPVPAGDDNYPVIGGLRGVRTGTTLTLYKSKASIEVELLADSSKLFEGLDNVTQIIGLDNLHSNNVTNMSYMFASLSSLTSAIDISGFNTDKVTNMHGMFMNCENLPGVVLPDNFGNASRDMGSMFKGDINLQLPFSEYNKMYTSKVEDFSHMFEDCKSITRLAFGTNFDTSTASNMKAMFKNMTGLAAANALNTTTFDTSKVTDMSEMFMGVSNLSANLNFGNFDTSNVEDMSHMFDGASSLTGISVFGWNTSKVVDMSYMFRGLHNINTDLTLNNGWNTGNVQNMSHMFEDTSFPTIYVDAVNRLNTSKVVDMSYMFKGAKLTNIAEVMDSFNTSRVTNMSHMFASMSELSTLDLHNFNVASVTDLSYIFADSSKLENVLYPAEFVTNATNIAGLFKGTAFNRLDLTDFNTSKATNMSYMFADMRNLVTIEVADGFVTSGVLDSDGVNMFLGTYKVQGFAGTTYDVNHLGKDYAVVDGSIDAMGVTRKGYFTAGLYELHPNWYEGSLDKSQITIIDIKKYPEASPSNADEEWVMKGGLRGYRKGTVVTIYVSKEKEVSMAKNSSELFSGFTNVTAITNLDILRTDRVNNMSSMFEGDEKLLTIDLSKFDTSTTSDMRNMFKGLKSITSIDLSSFDTSNVTNMSGMFDGVETVENLDLTNFNTSKVTNMSYMFNGAKSIKTLDVSSFSTINVTEMSYMFASMSSATAIKTRNFDTRKVRNMQSMFMACESLLVAETEKFVTPEVVSFTSMFEGDKSLTKLSLNTFEVQNARSLASMFRGMSSVSEIDIFSFDPKQVMNTSNMFADCDSLTTIYASARFSPSISVNTDRMFASSSNIVGGAGTVYDEAHIDGEYARLDKGSVKPGYFSGQSYTARLYAVGGEYANGKTVLEVKIFGDEPTNKFEIPTYPGHTFVGYYVNGRPINDTWIYSEEKTTTVYAVWTPDYYKVNYTSDGGIGVMSADVLSFDENYTIRNNEFTKAGYDFVDWSIDGLTLTEIVNTMTAGGKTIDDFIHTYLINNKVDEITFTATWAPKTYTITYIGNEGKTADGRLEYKEENLVYGAVHSLKANEFVRDNYTFNGWVYNVNDAETIYGDGAEVNSAEYRTNITLYANWIRTDTIYGKLILNGNGGKINGLDQDTILLTRYNVVPKVEVMRFGYKFVNWASGSDIVDYPSTCDFEELTLTANWEPITYKVRYYNNDGTENFVEKIATYNETFKIASYSGVSRFGYSFVGWTDDTYGSTVKYNEEQDVMNLSATDKGVVNLYAVWKGESYNIKLHNFDGITHETKEITYTYGNETRLTNLASTSYLDPVTGQIYEFSGWATSSNADRVVYYNRHNADVIFDNYNGAKDIDLYAVWVEESSLVYLTFDANGGLISGDKTYTVAVKVGDKVPYPTEGTITYDGYRFNKWTVDRNGTTEFNSTNVEFTADTTIYAEWANGSFTIEYIGLDKTSGNMAVINNVDAVNSYKILDSAYTRTGYKFVGWDTKVSARTVVYKANDEVRGLAKDGDYIRLYTVWEANDYTITYYDTDGVEIGTNILTYDKTTQLLSNTNIHKGKSDKGFTYTRPDGTIKTFISGQVVSKDDFAIDDTVDLATGIKLYGAESETIYTVKYITGDGAFGDNSKLYIATQSYGEALKKPSDPRNIDLTRSFLAWGIRSGSAINPYYSATYDFEEDITFEAIWQFENYKTILDANGGSFVNGDKVKQETLELGDSTKKLEIPIRSGYRFVEYYIDGSAMHDTWDYISEEAKTLKAEWEPLNFYVSFNPNGGEGAMSVEIGTYSEPFKVPDCKFYRDGYEFDKWRRYMSVDSGELIYIDYDKTEKELLNLSNNLIKNADGTYSAVPKDGEIIEFVAQWKPLKYTVKYDVNVDGYQYEVEGGNTFGSSNGVLKMEEQVLDYGEDNQIDNNVYRRNGYKFLGWALSSDSSVAYADGGKINTKDMYTDEITLYAKWQRDKEAYGQLHVIGNGGTINGVENCDFDLSIGETIPVPTVERKGYRLKDWTLSVAGLTNRISIASYPQICNFEDATITANWEPINYKVRFYENHEGSTNYVEVNARYDEPVTIPDYTGRYRGESFNGWALRKNDVVPIIGELVSFWAEGNKELIRKEYRPPVGNLATNVGEPTAEGEVINLYAIWDGIKYTIVLHDDLHDPVVLGIHVGTRKEFLYGYGGNIPGVTSKIATVNNTVYVFSGWATSSVAIGDPDSSSKVAFYDGQNSDNIYKNTSNVAVVLYAVWINKASGSTIVFDANDGTINGDKRRTVKFAYQDKLMFPDDSEMARLGYKFDGWRDDVKGITYTSSDDVDVDFAGDRVLKAQWTPGTYTINYNKTGEETTIKAGSTLNANDRYFTQVLNGNVKTVIADNTVFERDGYEFLGWDISEEAKTVVYKANASVDPIADVDEVVNLYAVWQPKYYTINYYSFDGRLIATNSILVGKNVRIVPNEGMTEVTKDAGYTYIVDGESYRFSSGQSVSAVDLHISKAPVANNTTGGTTPTSGSSYGSAPSGILGSISNFIESLFGGSGNTNKFNFKIKGETNFGGPGGSNVTPSIPSSGSVDLFGGIAPNTYKITFDANGGTYADGSTQKYASAENGESMTSKWPSPPTNGVIRFLGWSADKDGDGKYEVFNDTVYTFTETMTLMAIWEKDYKARLHSSGGVYSDGSDEMLVPIDTYGSTDKFEVPTRTGYTFAGYEAEGAPLTASWSYIIEEITDVYATWTPNNYKVAYTPGGGNGYMEIETATYDSNYIVASNSFVKAGYEFDTWRLNDTTSYSEGAGVTNLTNVKDGIVRLTATWKPLKYNITYYGNGGLTSAGLSEYKESGITYGADHTTKRNEFSRTGFTFRGWALASTSNVTYMNEGIITAERDYENEIELYAVWIRDTEKYGTLVLKGDGGLVNGVSIATMSYRINEAIPIPTLERRGYRFNNWVDTTNTVTTFPTKWDATWQNRTIELTATWGVNHYDVKYYVDEKDTNPIIEAGIAYDVPFTVRPKTDLTKVNYANTKWTGIVDGVEREFVEGQDYDKLTTVDGSVINIYANWAGDNYTITLHDTNPEIANVDITKTYTYGDGEFIESVTKKIATINNIEMAFAGWATNSTATKVMYYDSMSADLIYVAEGNNAIELWPVWVEASKVIYLTFDGNGGTVNGRERWTVPYATDSEIVYPATVNVKRRGFTFTGNWLENATDPTSIITKVVADFPSDTTIYADWDNSRTYRLQYIGVGTGVQGNMSAENKNASRNIDLTVVQYTRTGYRFIGWDTSPEASKVVYKDAETNVAPLADVGEIVNLYTVWEAKEYTITYYDYQGNLLGTNTLTYGKTVTLLDNSNIPRGAMDKGYTDIQGSTTAKYSSGQAVSGEELGIVDTTDEATGIKLYGLIDMITYVITFDANGGKFNWNTGNPADATSSIVTTIHYGEVIRKPAVPTRSYIDSVTGALMVSTFNGYTVDGIYYWQNTYEFTEAKTFYALWDQIPFLINFHANEPDSPDPSKSNAASGVMDSQPAFSDIEFFLKHNDFKISGYEFIGWTTSSTIAAQAKNDNTFAETYVAGLKAAGTYNQEIIEDGPLYPDDPNAKKLKYTRAVNQNIDLYALWGRARTRVTLIQNEAKGKFTIFDPYVVSDPLNAASQEVKDSATGEILYKNTFDIYYDSYLYEYPAFSAVGRVRNTYVPTGYFTTSRIAEPLNRVNFVQYNYFGGTVYTSNELNRVVGSLVLYPLWKNSTKDITAIYDSNYAKWSFDGVKDNFVGYIDAPYYTTGEGDEPKDLDGKIYDLIGLPEDVRIFSHWSENADGSATISEATIYTGANTEIYGNIRFRDNYVVSYKGNGGKTATGATEYDQIMVEGIADSLIANKFLKEGYSFGKWKDVYDSSSTYDNLAPIDNPKKALTLLAEWREVKSNNTTDDTNTDKIDDSNNGNNNYKPGKYSPGGPGGGGGGKSAGGRLQRADINCVILTPIPEADFEWIKDDAGIRTGVKLKKESYLGKALTSTQELTPQYMILSDKDYIQLKAGFFNVQYGNGFYYFGFDDFGKLMTGFVTTEQNTPIYDVNKETMKLAKLGQQDAAKYYLLEDKEGYYGIVWNLPITINFVMYEFDVQGRVIKETNLNAGKDSDAAWEYDPINDKWKYFEKDLVGNKKYVKNELRGIEHEGQVRYYLFDEEGYMKTGLANYQGNVYYLEEVGPLKGSVFVGTKTIAGKQYTFNEQGKYVVSDNANVNALSLTEAKVNAYPVGENGDSKEAKPQMGLLPLKTFTAKVYKQ